MEEKVTLRFKNICIDVYMDLCLSEGRVLYINADKAFEAVWPLYDYSPIYIKEMTFDIQKFGISKEEFVKELALRLTPTKDEMLFMWEQHMKSIKGRR